MPEPPNRDQSATSLTGPERLLIVLSPPRSYSSIISTMIGQHPDLYGFPELHLFIGDTVQEVLDREYRAGNYFGPPGLLRAIAQLEFGGQTKATIIQSIRWVAERQLWSTKDIMDHLCGLVAPRIAVEKSPVNAFRPIDLERTWTFFPRAFFLHLTRNPVATSRSMDLFQERRGRSKDQRPFNSLLSWYRFHRNILDFTRRLPSGQSMLLKGEDILSDPEPYLGQIAEWLGVDSDDSAIGCMKRPEYSPYAYLGPAPAYGGNDVNFMRKPHLRAGRVQEPSLDEYFAGAVLDWISPQERDRLSASGYTIASTDELIGEVGALAHRLGYR